MSEQKTALKFNSEMLCYKIENNGEITKFGDLVPEMVDELIMNNEDEDNENFVADLHPLMLSFLTYDDVNEESMVTKAKMSGQCIERMQQKDIPK